MQEGAAHGDVSKGDAFANQEGSGEKMGVEGGKGTAHVLLGTLSVAFVELHDAHTGEHPGAGCWQDLII